MVVIDQFHKYTIYFIPLSDVRQSVMFVSMVMDVGHVVNVHITVYVITGMDIVNVMQDTMV